MCDFEGRQLLRVLPCTHEFHAKCVDKWLKVSSRNNFMVYISIFTWFYSVYSAIPHVLYAVLSAAHLNNEKFWVVVNQTKKLICNTLRAF